MKTRTDVERRIFFRRQEISFLDTMHQPTASKVFTIARKTAAANPSFLSFACWANPFRINFGPKFNVRNGIRNKSLEMPYWFFFCRKTLSVKLSIA